MEFYKSMDYFFITRMVSDWMRYAGPKARKEFLDQVKEHVWDARERTENSFERGYVFNFAADYSNEIYSAGEYLVYLFVDSMGEIYYVGMGNSGRIRDKKNRNEAFKEHYAKCNSKIVILSKWSTKYFAADIEKLAIWECQLHGAKLTNEKDTLSQMEIYELRHIPDEWQKRTPMQREYVELKKRYKESVEALDSIEKWLYGGGASSVPEYVNEKVDYVYANECWTIDGITKSRSQWCKEHKMNVSKANKRIEIGCTPKEALTFPTAPENRKRYTKEWWLENGYVPGTDTTSYVTPVKEWPDPYRKRR